MWTDHERYNWRTYLSSPELQGTKAFIIKDYYGYDVDSSYLADCGYCCYFKSKRYPSHWNTGARSPGSSRIILKNGRSQIVIKINRYFIDYDSMIEFLNINHKEFSQLHLNKEETIRVITETPKITLDNIFENFTMSEILEHYNNKKYEEIGSKIKPTPVIRLIPNEIEDISANLKRTG